MLEPGKKAKFGESWGYRWRSEFGGDLITHALAKLQSKVLNNNMVVSPASRCWQFAAWIRHQHMGENVGREED